jgi:hypothetical protein
MFTAFHELNYTRFVPISVDHCVKPFEKVFIDHFQEEVKVDVVSHVIIYFLEPLRQHN